MVHKRFTISAYYEHEGLYNEETMQQVKPVSGYNTIADVLKWCEDNKVCTSVVSITEWDLNSLDAYGIPDIIAHVNLDCAVSDGVEDLSIYQL